MRIHYDDSVYTTNTNYVISHLLRAEQPPVDDVLKAVCERPDAVEQVFVPPCLDIAANRMRVCKVDELDPDLGGPTCVITWTGLADHDKCRTRI